MLIPNYNKYLEFVSPIFIKWNQIEPDPSNSEDQNSVVEVFNISKDCFKNNL